MIRLVEEDFARADILGDYLDETKEVLEERFIALMGNSNNLQGMTQSLSCGTTPTHVPLLKSF